VAIFPMVLRLTVGRCFTGNLVDELDEDLDWIVASIYFQGSSVQNLKVKL
jgi:hypothetical protein